VGKIKFSYLEFIRKLVAHVTGSNSLLCSSKCFTAEVHEPFIIVNCGIEEYWCSSLYFWTLLAIATSFKARSLENRLPH